MDRNQCRQTETHHDQLAAYGECSWCHELEPEIARKIERRRAQMPTPGTRIRLIHTDDPHTDLKPGDEGTVTQVSKQGDLHMKWDSGSMLNLLPDFDKYEVVTTQ